MKKLTNLTHDYEAHLFENIERWNELLKREDLSPDFRAHIQALKVITEKNLESRRDLREAISRFNGEEEIKA